MLVGEPDENSRLKEHALTATTNSLTAVVDDAHRLGYALACETVKPLRGCARYTNMCIACRLCCAQSSATAIMQDVWAFAVTACHHVANQEWPAGGGMTFAANLGHE